MNILDTENDIVSELAAQITDNTITKRSFPDDPAKYIRRRENSILVRYQGSAYSLPEPNRAKKINQTRTPSFIITIITKGVAPLTGHRGAYAILQDVRQALTEYTPGTRTGGAVATALKWASMMYPTADRYVGQDAGQWEYEMIFAFQIEETKEN